MTVGATLVASLLATLANPSIWPLALAAFLVRGGLLLVVAPILPIPSAVGLANGIGPLLTSFVFGGVSADLVVVIVIVVVAGLAWLVAGGLLAALAEVELIRIVAIDDDVVAATGGSSGTPGSGPDRVAAATPDPRRDAVLAGRILLARAVANAPLVAALAWGSARIVAAVYRELTNPSDVTSPVIVRVVREVPEAVALVILAWILGEIAGALATRRIVLGGDDAWRAVAAAIARMARHPLRVAVLWSVPTLALLAVVLPSYAAAAASWDALRAALADGTGPLTAIVSLLVFITLWVGGLVLLAVVAGWRAATWTVEGAGTYGGATGRRQGD